jgi:hypothetical protein
MSKLGQVVCRVRDVCPRSSEGDVFMLRNATRPTTKKVATFPTEDLVLTYKTSQCDTLQESTPSCVRYGPIKERMCRHTENGLNGFIATLNVSRVSNRSLN